MVTLPIIRAGYASAGFSIRRERSNRTDRGRGSQGGSVARRHPRRGVLQEAGGRAVKALGGLDLLVNNAARQVSQPALADVTTEQFDASVKTNVYAMFWIAKAALPHLPAGAVIINTASVQVYEPSPNLVDYAMTKSPIVSFSKSLAKQLPSEGIRVNAVAPGPFWTPLQPSGGQPQEAVETFGAKSPLGRPGQPAEIAATFVLLASAGTNYVTVEVFGNTGGRSPY